MPDSSTKYLVPTAEFYGDISVPQKHYEAETQIVCQKYQTDSSKSNFPDNMALKASLRESTPNKYVSYIIQWMLYVKDFGNIEIHHVLDFVFSNMFDKVVEYSTINSAKCVVVTVFNILCINKHPLAIKDITEIV